ncbi:hypothetical protein [Salinithrix halophila]|uniref:hypothetical protein n=1 Tax=Salinithrix halophila TaxID=1485204 RepID=UPI0036D37DD0
MYEFLLCYHDRHQGVTVTIKEMPVTDTCKYQVKRIRETSGGQEEIDFVECRDLKEAKEVFFQRVKPYIWHGMQD